MSKPEIISITRKLDMYEDPYYLVLTTLGTLKAKIQREEILIFCDDIAGREQNTWLLIGEREYRARAHILEDGTIVGGDRIWITNRRFLKNDNVPKTHREKIFQMMQAANRAIREQPTFKQDRKEYLIEDLNSSLNGVKEKIKRTHEELQSLLQEKMELEDKLAKM